MTWPWTRPSRDLPPYVDTPAGILSAGGARFRTTERLLRDYAGPVVEAVGMGPLVRAAEAWLAVPTAAGVLGLLGALVVLPWAPAALAGLALYALAALAAPGLANRPAAGPLRVVEHPVVQGLLYVLALSAFAASGHLAALWTGLVGFVVFRLGVVESAFRPVLDAVFPRLYPLPPADQTLRAIVVREALRRGVDLPGMAEIERQARDFWRR